MPRRVTLYAEQAEVQAHAKTRVSGLDDSDLLMLGLLHYRSGSSVNQTDK
jgi:hypothetical protein